MVIILTNGVMEEEEYINKVYINYNVGFHFNVCEILIIILCSYIYYCMLGYYFMTNIGRNAKKITISFSSKYKTNKLSSRR